MVIHMKKNLSKQEHFICICMLIQGKNLISWEMKLHNLESGMKRENKIGIS